MPPRLRRLVALCALTALGAAHRSRNFQVEAPTPEIARQVADAAERHRKELALLWLGKELPPWPEPCALTVRVTLGAPAGASTFQFPAGKVIVTKIDVQGPLDRVFRSVLPHEIAHTVLAHSLRAPLPRWADEGAALLAGDGADYRRFDAHVQRLFASGREVPLRRLFGWLDFPADRELVLALYAQGYSVARFLVERRGRPAFLAFVAHGLRDGWDKAAQASYSYRDVEALERAWQVWVRNPPVAASR